MIVDFVFLLKENSSPAEYLRDMQCMWFELEMARAYRRLKKYGEALKKCHEIDRVTLKKRSNFFERFVFSFFFRSISKNLSKINSIFIRIVFVKWCFVLMLTCSILKII